MKRFLFWMVLLASASLVWAETFTWTGGTGKMTDASKWEGAAAPVFTNGTGKTADIVLPDNTSVLDRPIVTMTDAIVNNPSKTKYYFRSLTGDRQYTLYLPHWDYSYQYGHTLEVEDPSAFYGTISVYHTASHRGPYAPILRATSSDPAKRIFRRVIADGRLTFAATNGTVLKVEQPIGLGMIDVGSVDTDTGTVELLSSPGGQSHATVMYGTLRLHGNPNPDAGPVDGAWLHLDASKPSTMTLVDGRVTAWRDVSGTGPTATRHAKSKDDPALVTDAASGLNVVDFGAFGGSFAKADTILPDNTPDFAVYGKPCALTLPAEQAVKEMFVVYREHTRTSAAPLWFGRDYSYGFETQVSLIRARDTKRPGQLFSTTQNQARQLNWAEIRLDGQRVTPDYRDDCTDRLHVLSVGFDGGSTLGKNIGFGRDSGAYVFFGGFQLAEVLLYTNALTSAQRRQVNAYLKRKWLPKAVSADWDLGRVEMYSEKCRLEVADGVASIRELKLPSWVKTVEKFGAGDLVIDRVFCGNVPTNLPAKAGAGNAWFADHYGAITCEKAADPDLWLDASEMTGSSFLSSNAVEYVTQWKDRREGGRNNRGEVVTADRYVYGGRVQAYATRQTVTINGVEKTIVDFGAVSTNNLDSSTTFWTEGGQDSATYRINYNGALPTQANYARLRECFMVVRRKSLTVTPWGQGVSGLYDFYSSTNWRFYTRGFCNVASEGALYEVNGHVVSGSSDSNGMNTSDFFVLSIAAGDDVPVTGFACNRGQYRFGGLQIAEVLFYDRPLSPAEHRNTTAYLMQKWLGKDHPEDVGRGTIPTVDIPAGQDAVVGSDDDVTIGQVYGGGGAFVKQGSGKVTVTAPVSSASFTSIDVTEGELEVKSDILGGSYFRLDTTDWEETMTITNGSDETKWVTEWRDPRGNGKAARAYVGKPVRPGVSPQLVDMTIGSKNVKALTCGPMLNKSSSTTDATGYFTEAVGATTAAMDWSEIKSERQIGFAENYAVHARRNKSDNLSLFGVAEYDGSSWKTNVSGAAYSSCYPYRCGDNGIANASLGAAVYYGQLYVNDDDTNVTGSYNSHTVGDFRLFCSVPLAPVWIGAFGRRETYDFGGSYWLETAVFTKTNSVAARNKIRGYLYDKWFNGTETKTSYDRLSVANGGKLTLSIADSTKGYSVAALAGDGTIDADGSISGVSSLNLTGALTVTSDVTLETSALPIRFRSGSDYDHLTSGGTLTLPANCAVTVTSDLERLPPGDYPILSAETLVGDISGWTLDASTLKKNCVFLRKDGQSVVLSVSRIGFSVIVR